MEKSSTDFFSEKLSHLLALSSVIQPIGWKKIFLGFGIVVTVAILSGVTTNAFRGQSIPLVPPYMSDGAFLIRHIDIENVAEEASPGVLIDARPNYLYKNSHIPEALNFPPGKFDFFYGLYFSGISKNVPLFICGRTFSRAYDEELAQELFLEGHHDITVVPMDRYCP